MNFAIWPYHSCNEHYQQKSNIRLNTSCQTHMNTSSGYESASTDTSLVEPYIGNLVSFTKMERLNMIYDYQIQRIDAKESMNDDDDDDDEHDHRKKRRILSRTQREEANRRERLRMEIINQAYEDLRNVLPSKKGRKRQKMSRMDTVDGAIQYIHTLVEVLHRSNYSR